MPMCKQDKKFVYHQFIVLYILFCTTVKATVDKMDTIPEDILFGFSTASYQIEGGWMDDGKGENVWDRLTHTKPNMIIDKSNGDVAADSYHKYKEDVQLLKYIGSQVYRFSISWSRLLPNGEITNINQAGVDYYNNLINELLANGIQPVITLFHWDLPQQLQEIGGWPNPCLADYFVDYAELAFQSFGDRVKWWITFNEPFETCEHHYSNEYGAPALNISGTAGYLAAHTIILAHSRSYHLYHEKYNSNKKGKVGISLNGNWHEAKTKELDDVKAGENAMQFTVGWFGHPIYSESGDYPLVMRESIDQNSKIEGRKRSRLPTFSQQELEYVRGTFDFFGLNHYTTCFVEKQEDFKNVRIPSWEKDLGCQRSLDQSAPQGSSWWLKVIPWGLRSMLNWIKKEYNNPPVFITENGFSDHGQIEDDGRINYYQKYLIQAMKAIQEDNCNVIGYTAWSLLDNFEWRQGYTEKFGICQVDFTDPKRPRKLKKSAEFFKQLLATRKISFLTNDFEFENKKLGKEEL